MMKSNRFVVCRSILALVALSTSALSLLSCGGVRGGAPSVTLQLNWVAEPEFGGFFAAADNGFYRDVGIELTIAQGGASIPAPQMVASGQVDFAVISGCQLLEIAHAGGDLVALYAVFQHNPFGVMVHEASPWKSLEALWKSDATVAVESGLAEYVWIDAKYGGKSLKRVPYTGSFSQFVADPKMANQCFVTAEPVQLALQKVPVRVFSTNEAGFDPYNCVVVTRRKFFDDNRELCAKVVDASAKGWRVYLDDPSKANNTMHALNSAMSLEAMTAACAVQKPLIETEETATLGLGAMTEARWQLTIDQLFEMQRIKSKPVPASLFHWQK